MTIANIYLVVAYTELTDVQLHESFENPAQLPVISHGKCINIHSLLNLDLYV
jgi:hypothetical protein